MILLFVSLFTVDNADMLLEKSQKMIERFNYPWEMMPLLYVILKYANGDLEEATNQLSEGNKNQSVKCKLQTTLQCTAYHISCGMWHIDQNGNIDSIFQFKMIFRVFSIRFLFFVFVICDSNETKL